MFSAVLESLYIPKRKLSECGNCIIKLIAVIIVKSMLINVDHSYNIEAIMPCNLKICVYNTSYFATITTVHK